MNSTTVRNIAVTIAAAVFAATQLDMARQDRRRYHNSQESHAQHMRRADANEKRDQQVHAERMRWYSTNTTLAP